MLDDARAKQALYLAKSPAKSSSGILGGWLAGKALFWLIGTAVILAGVIWILFDLF